jgi:hypothetical protein
MAGSSEYLTGTTVERAAEPGTVSDARSDVVVVETGSWERAISGNSECEKKLEHQ